MSFIDYIKKFLSTNKKNARFITAPFAKTFGDPEPLEIGLYDNDTPLINQEIGLQIIGGNTYIKTTDEEGIARLNINLSPGEYTCKCYWKGINGKYNSVTGYVEIKVLEKPVILPDTSISNGTKKQIILGCDSNTKDDEWVQETVAERLREVGYEVNLLPIGPNFFAECDYSSRSKNCIGIYLIASGIFSIADAAYGSGQFSNYVFGIRGDFGDRGATNFNLPIRADADCNWVCDKLDGKTFNEMNALLQPYVSICGGADADELAKNIIDWLRALENREPETTPEEPEHSEVSTELHEYFTNQGGGYLGQRTSYTCGPHSLVQCIHRLTGEDVSEMTLAGVCGTTTEGTDHEGLETGLAWFNRKYGYNLKMEWKNFSEVGFDGTQQAIENGACFHHILYRNTWGHYEVPKWTAGDPIYVLNSLGDYCGDGYCGYVEERTRSEHQSYINGISQKSVCIITRGE